MITGTSTVESVLPGTPAAIENAVQTVGAGIGPARGISTAWDAMLLPEWKGQAATKWAHVPRAEAEQIRRAVTGFNRAATALLRYQAAHAAARTEIAAAITDAATAERATATARADHGTQQLQGPLVLPGMPAPVPFHDPGAVPLARAQERAQHALDRFNQVGDEVAAELLAAAGLAHAEQPPTFWDQAVAAPGRFAEGAVRQEWDTLAGAWEMSPLPYILDNLLNHQSAPWWEQYGDLWGGIAGTITHDPGALAAAFIKDFAATDHWGDEDPGSAPGRVFFNILTLSAAGLGAVKTVKTLNAAKNLKTLKTAEAAEVATAPKVVDPKPLLNPTIDRSTPGGRLVPEDYDPLGGLTEREFIAKYWDADKVNWNGEKGGWKYPPDDGFDLRRGVPPPEVVTDMPIGYAFDRFGSPQGRYVSPEGVPFPQRALPPASAGLDYHRYKLVKSFDETSGFPKEGTVAPAFGQPGGGSQIKLPQKLKWLIYHGYVEEVSK